MSTIRRSKRRHIEMIDDGFCYRVSADPGWCFEQPDARGQNGLHELVTSHERGFKREALPHALRDYREAQTEPCEAAAKGICEWCGSEPPAKEEV